MLIVVAGTASAAVSTRSFWIAAAAAMLMIVFVEGAAVASVQTVVFGATAIET